MKNFRFGFLLATAFVLLFSCKKEDPIAPTEPQPNKVTINFNHVFGQNMIPFSANSWLVHPRTFDSLNFQVYKYYVSNVRLQKTDDTWYNLPESYHLICASCAATSEKQIVLNNVPNGSYKAIAFVLGVDSTRNVSGAQTGALDPALGMFWSWNSGYIMIKAEGNSPQSPQNGFAFHLGGFSGANNIIYPKTFPFAEAVSLHAGTQKLVKFNVNTARLWHSSAGLATTNTIHMPGPLAKTMATDFYDGFVYAGIE